MLEILLCVFLMGLPQCAIKLVPSQQISVGEQVACSPEQRETAVIVFAVVSPTEHNGSLELVTLLWGKWILMGLQGKGKGMTIRWRTQTITIRQAAKLISNKHLHKHLPV